MTPETLFRQIPTATLFLMMLAMGMTLSVADFRRVVSRPLAFAVGATGQLVVLPAVAFAIGWGAGLPPVLAIGLILIAACPGGVTSNAITWWAKGDTALSILLTGFSSLVAFATVPLVVGLGLDAFGAPGAEIVLPLGDTMSRLFLSTALPVVIGMGVRAGRPGLAERAHRPLLTLSTSVLILLVLALGVRLGIQERPESSLLAAVPPVATLIGVLMTLGWLSGRLLALPRSQSRTIAIEIGLQNFNLAMVLALSILQREELLAPALVYLPTMFAAVACLVWATRDPPARARGLRSP